ncbi:MAG: YciI family protein [Acidobacteriota bacterium]
MRFMMIVKASKDSEAGVMPEPELLEAMGKFNQEMISAGVMLDGAGLQSSAKGARVRIGKDEKAKRTVIDGPFAEIKELIAGYWVIQVKSKEEAIEWAMRCPSPHPGEECELELRQFFEMEDFGGQA